MADRVSIIRFKIDGIQGASSAIEQFSRQVVSQQAIMERSAKAIQQIQLGQALPGADLGKLQANLDKQQSIHAAAEQKVQQAISDIQFKAGNDRFAVEQRLLDRTRDERIKQISAAVPEAQRPQVIAAAEQIHQLATAEIAQKKTAVADKERDIFEKGQAAKQKAWNEEREQVAKLKADNLKIAQKAIAEESRAVQQGRAERQKNLIAEVGDWEKGEQRKIKITEAAGREKRSRIDEYANVLAGQDEARETAKQVAATEKRARIDEWANVFAGQDDARKSAREIAGAEKRARAEEWARVFAGQDEARAKAKGRGGFAGALSGFGGRMVLAHAAGIAAGDILGDRHGGQELGSIVGGFAFGGPVVGTAVAGLELVGAAFRAQRESAEAARKSTEDYGQTLAKMVGQWSGFTTVLVNQSHFGSEMEKVMKQAGAAAVSAVSEFAKVGAEGPGISDYISTLRGKPLPIVQTLAGLARQATAEKRLYDSAKVERDAEYEKHLADQRNVDQAQSRLGSLSTMAPGASRERAELSAQLLLEQAQRDAASRERADQAEAGLRNAKARSEELGKLADAAPRGTAKEQFEALSLRVKANEAMQEVREAEAAIHRIRADVARIEDQASKNAESRKRALVAEQSRAVETKLAEVDPDAAAMVHLREHRDLIVSGATREQAIQIETARYTVQVGQEAINAASARRDITLRTAEIERGMLADLRSHSDDAIAAAIRQLADAKEAAANSESISRSRLSAEQSILDVLYEQHRINTLEYEQAKALAADRRAQENPTVAAALARSVAVRDEAETVKDVMRYRVEKQQAELDLRVKRHQISERDADIERAVLADRRAQEPGDAGDRIRKEIVALADARQKLRDQEILNAGEFSTKYAAGHVDFRALNFDHPYGFYRANAIDRGFADKAWTKADFEKLNQDRQLEGARTPAHQYSAGDIPSGISEWLARPVAEGGPKTETDRLLAEILRSLQRQEQGALN